MSCSQFIEHDEDVDKSDTLVIIVNGDGTVKVDPCTLARVLNNQCRAAVSFVKLEEQNEPDSPTERVKSEKGEKSDNKDSCPKVNLVVEGYYPPPPLHPSKHNGSADSVVSSTVGTPPLPQTPTDFIDLLSEGLQIPVSQSSAQVGEGCIGDSLVDAFSEMAPEQLKQVETALHSEKAKQILGDDVTSVLDTLKMNDGSDDWVQLDHCYTSINNKGIKQLENIIIQDNNDVTFTTIKVSNTSESSLEELLDDTPSADILDVNEVILEQSGKPRTPASFRSNMVLKSSSSDSAHKQIMNIKRVPLSEKDGRHSYVVTKMKKKSISKSDVEELPKRIVKEDEVDGVKVFKPSKTDKRLPLVSVIKHDPNSTTQKIQLVQTKLNFNKKDEHLFDSMKHSTPKANIAKKEFARKTSSVADVIFGPALFSTPDIIKKISTDEAKDDKSDSILSSIDSELEKRMSAIENGELLENISLSYSEPSSSKVHQVDSRLLSDLENSADESSQAEEIIISTSDLDSLRKSEDDADDSDDSDENEGEYEDDPNKLWCICNKPHNNRFMICCDACDNWFHGHCVGVTKAMGEKMEQKGTEWLCPSCKKGKSANEKQKLFSKAAGKRRSSQNESTNNTSSSPSIDSDSSAQNEKSYTSVSVARRKSSSFTQMKSTQLCIECREKEVTGDRLYCSNVCIVRYVNYCVGFLNAQLPKAMSDEQKIIVVDRKRDQKVTGMRGPSVGQLREWLTDHPSFEIVKPSAFPMNRDNPIPADIKPVTRNLENHPKMLGKKENHNSVNENKAKVEMVKLKTIEIANASPPSQTSIKQFFANKTNIEDRAKVKSADDGEDAKETYGAKMIDAMKRELDLKMKDKPRQIKVIPVQPIPKPVQSEGTKVVVVKTVLAKQPVTKAAQQVPPKPTAIPVAKKPTTQTPSTAAAAAAAEKVAVKRKAEPLKKDNKVPAKKPELKRQDSEREKSTIESASTSGVTDKEKIRSGIKKSLSDLFAARLNVASDLEMKTEEVNELANQIEIELFSLFNNTGPKYKLKYRSLRFNINDEKNNLFRRIVNKSVKPFDLVRLTPEEMASTELAQWREREAKHELEMIKKTELENLNQAKVLVLKTHKGELEIESDALPPSVPDTVVPDLNPDELPVGVDKSKKSTFSKLNIELRDALKNTSKKDRDRDKEKEKSKRHEYKEKDKHRSHKHHRRSSEYDSHRSRNRRSRSKEREKVSSEKDKGKRSSEKKHENKSSDKDKHRSRSRRDRSGSRNRRKERTPEKKEDVSTAEVELVEGAPKVTSADKGDENSPTTSVSQEAEKIEDLLSSYRVDVDLSDMEPTSTVTIQTPPRAISPDPATYSWKGNLVMPDIIKLHARLREVSGNSEGLTDDLASTINCVGRINPNTVWEYISKTKKTGSREILVLRFEATDDEQRANYFTLYSYLNRKDRMAVVGPTNSCIKDFYVIPLAGHCPIPQVLLPLDGPGFEDSRSHLLLAVIVRSRRHAYTPAPLATNIPMIQYSKKEREPYVPSMTFSSARSDEEDTFTPPHSPTSVFVGAAASTLPSTVAVPNNDEDEPYNPEDEEPYSPGQHLEESEEKDTSMEIPDEVEMLARQIEEQKQQLESITSSLPPVEETELYSPTDHFPEPEPPNVELPGDLQQLINSLSKKSDAAPPPLSLDADPIVDAYKQDEDSSGDSAEEHTPPMTPPEPPEPADTMVVLTPELKMPETVAECGQEPLPEVEPDYVMTVPLESIELPEDTRLSRDPRRKPSSEASKMMSQPPPPGLEDEYNLPGISAVAATPQPEVAPMVEANYATSYGYPGTAPMAAYPPPMIATVPPMFMSGPPPGYPPNPAIPFNPIPTAQMYMPPANPLPTDPSMIPLPVEPNEKTPTKRKGADEEGREKDRDRGSSRRSDSHGGKRYRDSKSPSSGKRYRDSKSPTGRHSSSSYDSHHRGYRREDDYSRDDDYRSSRYNRRDDRSYHSSRSRSGYWNKSSDYSSSSRR